SSNKVLKKQIIFPLVNSLIGDSLGNCNLKVTAGQNVEDTSSNFKISNTIKISTFNLDKEYAPGQVVEIKASALKENGEKSDGEYSISIDSKTYSGNVANGEFFETFEIPSEFPAGIHNINLTVNEFDSLGKRTNFGKKLAFLEIIQVPTTLEISLDKKSVMPGEYLTGKIILHDQTGKSILGKKTEIKIKGNAPSEFLTETGIPFEYKTAENTPPGKIEMFAYSEGKSSVFEFEVLVNKKISSTIVNNTLTLENTGNVFYDEILSVKIGNESVDIPLSLGVGESERYLISAPDGEYDISVEDLQKRVFLSGNAIQLSKISDGPISMNILILIFILIIIGLGAYIVFMRGHRRKTILTPKPEPKKEKTISQKAVSEPKEISEPESAELSLSITGSKQNSTVGCISVKNYDEAEKGIYTKETLGKISNLIKENKGFIYTNNNYMFFVFAPSFTKTFKNQKIAIEIAQKIKEIFKAHNKRFKQKIEFGISVNDGTIIAKTEKGVIKFMSLGTLMTESKKIANSSGGEVLVSEKFKLNLDEKIKGDPVNAGGVKAYILREIVDRNNHSTFIKGFLARQEKEKAKQNAEDKKEN
ncbi:MAG: hypothetical protein KKB62_03850, partial [Nanoarchaeota archaeon]|nr:hypothetical protein [Nanoarchaeota archaeon]